jgi:hypothetical protein
MSADQQTTAAPSAAPVGMKWTGGKLPKELLQQFEAEAAQGKPEVAAMLQSYYQANPQPTVMPKSATLADFMTADQQATQQTTQQTTQATQQPYTPSNIDVNAQAAARLKRQGAAPPQYKSAVGQAFQDAFDNLVMRPKEPSILANAIGAGEAGLTTATGALAYPLGAVAGIGGTLLSGKYGTQEGIQAGNKVASDVASALTYQPRTQQGQGIVQNLQQLFEESKIPPVGLPEATGFAPLAGAAVEQAKNLKEPPQALGLQNIVQTGVRPASEVPAVMRKPANMTPQQLADMQAAFEAKKAGLAAPVAPVVTPSAAPSVTPVSMATAGSAGAAAASNAARISELLSRASPELQNATKEIINQGGKVNPQQLENRVKAEQFDIKLTEGEASQDLAKMSEEYNSIKQNPAMADHLANIPKKLSDAFNQIKEKIAPDVNEPDPVKAANLSLEKMVQQDVAMREDISNNYKTAANLNGGELPLSGENFVATANAKLKEANPNLYRYLPPEIQSILDSEKLNGNMPYNNFEFYRTLLGNEERAAKRQGKLTVAFAIGKVRDGLESTPMSEAAAPVKAAYDIARSSAEKRFDLIKKNPAFETAISDTRTPEEINLGVLHPAANTFVDRFYSHKTPDVQVKRLIDLIGQNSEAHQGLNAAVIDKIAKASGVKGSPNDVVRQSALNNQVRTVYKTNLGTMFPSEGVNLLNDLADVSALTEHTGAGKYSNVSKTAITAEPKPVTQFVKKGAETLLHGALVANNPVLGFAYGAAKEGLKSRAARKALETEAAALAEKNAAPFKEGAGITYKLNDIKNLGSK